MMGICICLPPSCRHFKEGRDQHFDKYSYSLLFSGSGGELHEKINTTLITVCYGYNSKYWIQGQTANFALSQGREKSRLTYYVHLCALDVPLDRFS